MYEIFLTNFGYPLQETRDTIDDAVEYGKSKGFEFQVYKYNTGTMVASWTYFGGLRRYPSARA